MALDLGCGHGRHVILLAEQGYKAYGLDISDVALDFAKRRLKSVGLKARLTIGSGTDLPYVDERFELVISHGLIDHVTLTESQRIVSEANRVLKAEGLFYVDLISTLESGYKTGEPIGDKTYVITDGDEKGAIQRFFDIDDVLALLDPKFDVLDVVLDQWEPLLGAGFSSLHMGGYQRAARYHVAARKK